MKILIGTQNKGKIEGIKTAFEKYFQDLEILSIGVDSEVPEQPFNNEVIQGGKNRVKNLKQYAKDNNILVDYYIATEAGIFSFSNNYIDVNVAVIQNSDGIESVGFSQGFPIPNKYIDDIKENTLGKVMDKIFKDNNLNTRKRWN